MQFYLSVTFDPAQPYEFLLQNIQIFQLQGSIEQYLALQVSLALLQKLRKSIAMLPGTCSL